MAELDSEFGFLAASVRRSVELLRAYPQKSAINTDERGSALCEHIECRLLGAVPLPRRLAGGAKNNVNERPRVSRPAVDQDSSR